MMPHKVKSILFASFIALASLISTVHSSIILHIDTIGNPGAQSLRVVSFDSKRQKLLRYETLAAAPFARTVESFLGAMPAGANPDRERNYTLNRDVHGSITITAPAGAPVVHPSVESYIVMSVGPIQTPIAPVPLLDPHLEKYYWSSRQILEKTPDQLTVSIKGLKDKHKNDPEFMLTLHNNPNFHYLSSLTNGGKGSFGELISRMTMFSYGYTPRASIYGGNQGLDGIFVSFSGTYLLLSQSKVGNANPMAETVIKKELGEPHINERLKLMARLGDDQVKASRLTVLQFMQNTPQGIYKMAQCLFNCGLADMRFSKFDVTKMPRENVKLYGAADQDKVKAVKSTLRAFEQDAESQLELALASMNLDGSPQKAMLGKLMNALGIDEDTQEDMLAHLPDDE